MRQDAQTGGFANDRLVYLFPKRGGPHEGFVVKTRGQEIRELIVDRHASNLQRRPAVLALGSQPSNNSTLWRGCWVLARAAAQFDQRVRFF